MFRWILSFAVCFLAVSAHADTIEADLAIIDASVVSPPRPVAHHQTILIAGSKIIYVGPATEFKARRTIDASRRYVMPGMIDAHVHLSERRAFATEAEYQQWVETGLRAKLGDYLRYGFTTVLSVGDYWPIIGKVRDRVRSGEIKGPRLLISGPLVAPVNGHGIGDNPACKAAPFCARSRVMQIATVAEARRGIKELAAGGVDGIKLSLQDPLTAENTSGAVDPAKADFGKVALGEGAGSFPPGVLEALIDEAHAHRLPVRAHTGSAKSSLQVIRAGVDALAHGPGVFDALRSDTTTDELLTEARRRNVPITTTASVSSLTTDIWGTERFALDGTTGIVPFLKSLAPRQLVARGLRGALDKGVVVAFGTDSIFIPRVQDAAELEFSTLFKNGLTPAEVLSTVTVNGARFLNLSDMIGSIDKGKEADLLILSGNPLELPAFLDRIDVVVKGGDIAWTASPSLAQ